MRKTTLKISTFLLLTMFVLQGYGQALDADANGFGLYNPASPGTWKVKLRDQVGGKDLFLTVRPSDLRLEYAEELPDTDPLAATQLWIFDAHPTVTNMSMMTSAVPDIGFIKIDEATTGTPTPIVGTTNDNLAQIQLRKNSGSEPDYASNGDMPGQNQIFLRGDYAGTEWADQSSAIRFGTTPVQDEVITFGTSGLDFRFKFIAPLLSNEEFDTSSIFISNPVKNQISIKGLTSNVKQVSLYSLLGQEVLTRKIGAQSSLNIDISALKSGMYLVEMKGENATFTKKIVKQ